MSIPTPRRRRVPKVPARLWALLGRGLAALLAIVFAGFLTLGLMGRDAEAAALQQVMFLLVVIVALFIFIHQQLTKAELDRKLTTDPWRHPEVDLVEWRTGIVLRNAGSPAFRSRAELQAARANPPHATRAP